MARGARPGLLNYWEEKHMLEFFQMGGYAAYVWPAYGITALCMILVIVQPIRKHQKLRQTLSQLHAERIQAERP
jgi:heme exporter protein D